MNISKIWTILYTVAKYLGDIDAIRKGRVKQRVRNRLLGKITGRMFK